MLSVSLPATEFYDAGKNEFTYVDGRVLHLEHSLFSISKWEAKWKKPFLGKKPKTQEEILDYICCMSDEPLDVKDLVGLSKEDAEKINEYINANLTATTFGKENEGGMQKIITSEVIYYLMTANNIPFECDKWHLSRLLTLLQVCAIKNGPQKKASAKDTLRRHAALNAKRREKTGSRG